LTIHFDEYIEANPIESPSLGERTLSF